MVAGLAIFSYTSWLPQVPQNWRTTPWEER